MRLERSVETQAAPEKVFAYLSDFTTTTEWDPGTVKTVQTSGDGGVGTTYDNTSTFNGRETQLTYTVIEHQAPSRIVLRGTNKTVEATDSITVEPIAAGSRVTYSADFTFKGIAKLIAPFLGPSLKKLGDEAEEGLREALARL